MRTLAGESTQVPGFSAPVVRASPVTLNKSPQAATLIEFDMIPLDFNFEPDDIPSRMDFAMSASAGVGARRRS